MQHGHMRSKLGPEIFVTEFDEAHRILHMAYKRTIHPTTPAHLEMKFKIFRDILDQYIPSGKIYLIIDMTNFILEPDLKTKFAELARVIRDEYVMPDGIARYGFQITRITVRQSYNIYLNENPNIFNSRQEAYDYIYSLIDKHRAAGMTTEASIPEVEPSKRLSER
jgi:hypothetical protein